MQKPRGESKFLGIRRRLERLGGGMENAVAIKWKGHQGSSPRGHGASVRCVG